MKSVFLWILSLKQQKGSCRFTKIHSLKRQPLSQPLMKDPQQVWQTLKNFDYPFLLLKISKVSLYTL